MARRKSRPKISPEQYRHALQKINMDVILLDSCSMKTNREKVASNVNLDVRHKASYVMENETSAAVRSVYDLVVFETTKKDFVLKLSCTYTILFTSEEPITSDFMDIFVDINVEMTTWPYFREFVQNMVQRTGLPPLTLPLLVP